MELTKYKHVRIKDICIWERAKKAKIYPEGSFCVQVSATKGQMEYLNEEKEVESKYCVFQVVSNKYLPAYVYMIFKMNLPEYLRRAQTGLNIVPEIFNEYEIDLHTNIDTQHELVNTMRCIDTRIQEEERQVKAIQKLKKYHLQKMFPDMNR